MLYFVLADDGGSYGPADIPTLNQWIQQGRVVPTTLLQPQGTSSRVAASTVPGLIFAAGQTYSSYTPQAFDRGQSELKAAWICFAVALLCGCAEHLGTVASVLGIFLAYLSIRKGNKTAPAVLILCAFALVFRLVTSFYDPFSGLMPSGIPGMPG